MEAGSIELPVSGEVQFGRKPDEREGVRLHRFYNWLRGMVRAHKAAWIVFEDVKFQSTQAQTRLWSGWLAMALLVAEQERVQIRGFGTNVVKMVASGKGNAGKERMRHTARDRWQLDYLPTDNEADALCCLYTFTQWANGKFAPVEKDKTRARAKRKQKDPQTQLFDNTK